MKVIKRLLICASVIAASSGLACTCMNSTDPEEARREVEVVFAGRAVDVRPVLREYPNGSKTEFLETTFEVSRVWKGDVMKRVTVTTVPKGAQCGYRFRAEQSYIVYGTGAGDKFATHLCTATKPLEKAEKDVDVFGEGREPR